MLDAVVRANLERLQKGLRRGGWSCCRRQPSRPTPPSPARVNLAVCNPYERPVRWNPDYGKLEEAPSTRDALPKVATSHGESSTRPASLPCRFWACSRCASMNPPAKQACIDCTHSRLPGVESFDSNPAETPIEKCTALPRCAPVTPGPARALSRTVPWTTGATALHSACMAPTLKST